MTKECYEFEVQLMVNGEFLKDLKKVRVMGKSYEECERKLINYYNKMANVKLIDIYFIENYLILEWED